MRQMLVALVVAALALVVAGLGSPARGLADNQAASTRTAEPRLGDVLVAAAGDEEEDDEEEEEEEEDESDQTKAVDKTANGVAGARKAQQAKDKVARQFLKQVGLQLGPGMTVTSVHVAAHETPEGAKPAPDSPPPVAELDVTLACDGSAEDVQGFFEKQLDQSVVMEQFRRDRMTVLVRTPHRRPGQPPQPKVVQVLIDEPKLDAQGRARWAARLAALQWHHVDVEKRWIRKQLAGKELAAFTKALEPVEDLLENLLLALRTGLKRGVRPMDLSADETAQLVAEYRAVFDKFAPGPMPDTPRHRVERREMIQKQTALAGKLFVRIHVTVSPSPRPANAGSSVDRQ